MKNSNTVAAERRMDLASLFCMIGRHGPAVALAVIAMMSVLAGFVIYRTVRGKRRKATAAADEGDDQSPGAERDASVIQPSPEEPRRVESTDISNEVSDAKEDADLIQSDLVIRHRRAAADAAAAEKKPPPYSPPNSNVQVPENKHTTSDVTEEMAFVQDSHKVAGTFAEEANQAVFSDTYTVAEMVMEDNADWSQGVTDDVVKDVIEAAHGNDSCLKEPEPINEESRKEKEKVLEAERQEIEDVTTEKDVLDKNTRQEEENFVLCDLNNPVCFGQTPHMSERGDDDRLQVNKTTLEVNSIESNLEEPVIYIDDVPAPCICYSKDEELEKEGEKDEDERAEEECVDNQEIAQQAEMWFSTYEQEPNLPSTEQDQCDHMTDNVVASIGHGDSDEDSALAGEMIEEVVDKDHLNKLTAVGCDDHLPQFDEQEVAIEQKAENSLTCNEKDGVLHDCTDQGEDRMLNSDNIVACSEECGSSSVALPCLSTPVKVDNHDNSLSDITTDIKVDISGIADSPDVLLDCQQPQKEDEKVLSLGEDTDSTILGSQMSSHETKNQPENNENGSNVMLADEFSNNVHDPHIESYQQSVQMIRNEALEKACVAANPDAVEMTASEKVEEISLPQANWHCISGIADSPDVLLDCQQPQKEDEKVLSLGEDTDSTILGSQMSSDETKNQPENNENGSNVMLADEFSDHVHDPYIESYKDQQSVPMIRNEALEKACVAANPDAVEMTASEKVEEISLPQANWHCISGIADSPDVLLDCQQPQKEDEKVLSLGEDTDSTILGSQVSSHETENQPENNEYGSVMLADEFSDHVHDPHIESYQQSVPMIENEAFEKASVAANPDAVEITASEKVEEISFPHPPTICQDQQSHSMENDETSDKARVHSVSDTNVCHEASLTALLKSEEISHPDMLCSTQDQQSDHIKNNGDFPEVTTSVAPDLTEDDISPPMYQIYLSSFEQSDRQDNDLSSPGVDEESGISSMAVSPDFQDASFDVAIGNMVLPVIDCYQQAEGQIEAQNSLFADDVAVSVMNENTAGMVFGPYPSHHSQEPRCEQTAWTKSESFAANEDMFGHEIEDGYHKAMDQFMAQISASVTSFTDDLKIQTDMKAVIEVSEMKEKKAELCVEKKKETKDEEEKEEDYEKTEISIMEATMDNNEWITESNYQVLPWLGLSASSFVQDQTKINQLPTEECQYSSAGTDTTCIDTTDIPPSTEDSALSIVEENKEENNKKVVAVQPMPQNVNVTFRVHYFTQSPYQTVAVTGNQQELGNWKEFIPLERAKDGHWATVVSLPAECHVEWKFVVLDKGEVCRWEECGNRLLDTGYGDDLLVHKWWGLL